MLIEIAVADAYGAGFEFKPAEFIKSNNDFKYHKHAIDSLDGGMYTDDTQMSVAIAEMIVRDIPFTKKNVAQAFVSAFKRDPRKGYAKGFYQFLCETKNGKEFLANINPKSKRSGAAMRAVPLGIFTNEQDVLERASLQASVTHDTDEGILSAQAIAVAAHGLLYNKVDRKDLCQYVSTYAPYKYAPYNWGSWEGRVPCAGIACADAALTIISKTSSWKKGVYKAVELGGDTDTVAAIVGGLCSLSKHHRVDIPKNLIESLEDGKYGLHYLYKLDFLWRRKGKL